MDKKIAVGIVAGIGLKWASPFIAPVLGALVRPLFADGLKPLTKASLKLGFLGVERGRELLAHLAEALQDSVAEARAELLREADRRGVDAQATLEKREASTSDAAGAGAEEA